MAGSLGSRCVGATWAEVCLTHPLGLTAFSCRRAKNERDTAARSELSLYAVEQPPL
jgi:hypothetical protein